MPKLPIDDSRIVWPNGRSPGWTHTAAGLDGGKFGSVQHAAYGELQSDGTFLAQFDRPVVIEGPHAIAIAFGRDPSDGQFKIGLLKEQRDTAAPADGETSVFYWGPPRGFAEPGDQGAIAMAVRETGEEIGAGVLAFDPWILGEYITNETCTASGSPIVAVPVDLTRLAEIIKEGGRGEKILKAEFFTLLQVEAMIKYRVYQGALTNSMVLGQITLLYRLHLQQWESANPDTLSVRTRTAWYP
jgi:hypothetical protein